MSTYAVVNPATGETIKEYPTITDAELRAAIDRADAAHTRLVALVDRRRAGGAHPPRRRAARRAHASELARDHRARDGQAHRAGGRRGRVRRRDLRATTPTTPRACWPTSRSSCSPARARRSSAARSLGALLGIMPWNYPYYQVARFAGPNLMIGQHDPAQARAAVPGVGRGDGADLRTTPASPTGAYEQHLRHQRADRLDHRRPARARRLGHRLGARRRRRRRDRRAATSRRSCSSWAAPTRSSCSSTDDLDETSSSRRVAARLENAGQACNAAKRFIVVDELYDDVRGEVHARRSPR